MEYWEEIGTFPCRQGKRIWSTPSLCECIPSKVAEASQLANFSFPFSVLRSQREERKDINEGLTGQIPKIRVCACSLQQWLFQRLLGMCPQLTVPTGFLENSFADGFLLRSPEQRQVQAIQNYWIDIALNKGGNYHKVISLDLSFTRQWSQISFDSVGQQEQGNVVSCISRR